MNILDRVRDRKARKKAEAKAKQIRSNAIYADSEGMYLLGDAINFWDLEEHNEKYPGEVLDAEDIENKLNRFERELAENGHTQTSIDMVIVARWTGATLIRDGSIDIETVVPYQTVDGKVYNALGSLALPSGRTISVQLDSESYHGEWDFWVTNTPGRYQNQQSQSYSGIMSESNV